MAEDQGYPCRRIVKMGAFSSVDNIMLPRTPEEREEWGWEPHETITIKGKASTEDIDAINVGDQRGKRTQVMLERFITAWTLTYDNGQPVKVNPTSISQLPGKYIIPITLEVGFILNSGKSEEEMKAFLISAIGRN
jgi:hypothetical protein